MSSEQQKYTDVGMIIPGAPKLRAKAMVDALDFTNLTDNVADSLGIPVTQAYTVRYDPEDERNHHLLEEWQQGLSKDKLWPAPAYAELIEKGIPPQLALFIKNLRDALPRHAHRPTPETLEAFSDLVAVARRFADDYLTHWEQVADRFPEEPPSYGRIAQIAALVSDISARHADIRITEAAFPVRIAPPLPEEAQMALRTGFDEAPSHKEALREIESALATYRQADRNQGSSYRMSGPCPSRQSQQAIRKSGKALTQLIFRTHESPFELMRDYRSMLRYNITDSMTSVLPDRQIGFHLPILNKLKLKPAALPDPLPPGVSPEEEEETKRSTAKQTKARRPERLSASEAKELLRAPEDDGEDEDKYQDLNALIEMGMVRGIQWGEWVPQKERATLVKNIFLSFEHFAEGMQITPSLAGLGNPVSSEQRQQLRDDGLYESDFSGNESLGLALGARGKSSAAAHYEPGLHAINLTRFSGAGALAHEMFHGLDYKLTQLLDLSRINANYISTDIRKTTASKKGITTFSELIAHHWWLKTYQNDRGEAMLLNPAAFSEENERLIKRFMKREVEADTQLKDQVMPLMIGTAEFIREMYHRAREPEEMLEMALNKSSKTIANRNQGTHLNLSSWNTLEPTLSTEQISPGLRALLRCHETLVDPLDEGFQRDAGKLRKAITDSLLSAEAASDLEADLSNWRSCDFYDEYDNAKFRIPYNATLQLEKLLDRDIPYQETEQIRDHLSYQIELTGAHAMLFEAAARKVRNLNSPPIPLDRLYNPDGDQASFIAARDFRVKLNEQMAAAVKETLAEAPVDLIERISRLSQMCCTSWKRVQDILQELPPTADGKMAGLAAINVTNDPRATKWIEGYHNLNNYNNATSLAAAIEPVSVLRVICDARSRPLQRDLIQPSGHLLEALSIARDSLQAALASEDYIGDHLFVGTLRSLRNSADDASLRRMMDSMSSNPLEFKDVAPMSTWDRRKLAYAMISTAYSDSTANDGTLTQFIKVMRDPTLLGDEMPKGLPTLFAYMNQFDNDILKDTTVDDWKKPDTLRAFAEQLIVTAHNAALPASAITRGLSMLDNAPHHLRHEEVNTMLLSMLKRCVISGDTKGIEALDRNIDQLGASFRYLPAEDRRDVLASFYGDDAPRMRELLGEDHFQARIHETTTPSATDDIERWADRIISASHGIVGQMRRQLSGENFINNLQSAKIRLGDLKVSHRAPSETLLHSAAYDDVSFNKEKFYINPQGKRGYWYSAKEMFARCSEAALHDVLEAKGIKSPYLVTVPSKKGQEATLKAIGANSYPGGSTTLNYPAGEERETLARTFEKQVVPHMENALSALFPDAVPAYEAYLSRQKALATRESMVARIDAEHEETMLAQNENEEPVPAPNETTHEAPQPVPKEPENAGGGASAEPSAVTSNTTLSLL